MEWVSALLFSGILGLRHGLDPDHMAAITDMVGTDTKAKRGVKLGLMYALGHGFIVLCIGLIAIIAGKSLPESFVKFTEILVGASLLVLGAIIIRSLFKNRTNFQYQSRWMILFTFFRRLYSKIRKREQQDENTLEPLRMGLLGAAVIGVVHGIGAETPTQLTIIGHSAQVGDLWVSAGILLMFVIGLLMSTSAISLISAWGFTKARPVKVLNLAMGLLAGGYSVYLGTTIILGA